jgi:hypothetical protein
VGRKEKGETFLLFMQEMGVKTPDFSLLTETTELLNDLFSSSHRKWHIEI